MAALEVALPNPRRPKQQDIGALSDPAVTWRLMALDVPLGQHGTSVNRMCRVPAGEAGVPETNGLKERASVTFCQFVFHLEP